MKRLFLITNAFPYGRGEKNFIIPEIPYLVGNYNLSIVSKAVEEDKRDCSALTDLSPNIRIINLIHKLSFWRKLKYGICTLFDTVFWRECIDIILKKKRVVSRVVSSFYNLARGKELVDVFLSQADIKINEKFIVYSFWCTEFTVAAAQLKKKYRGMILVTRMLGYDLYNERVVTGRQEYRWYINKCIDSIFFETIDDLNYYKNNFLSYLNEDKLVVSGLGVMPQKQRNPERCSETFEIVSCSNVIPLKRINLIIDGLRLIPEYICIKWVHFGEGKQFLEIASMAKKLDCKNNIIYEFKGYTPNTEIMDYYLNNHIDCFITVSSSEAGVPISVLEALSVGIPIIATDVGGIRNGINNNGVLLSENPSPQEVCDAILSVVSNSQNINYGENSYNIWKEQFNTEKIKKTFISTLNNLMEKI